MAIAKVNVGDVDAFRQSIETQKNVVYENIESFHTACDEIGERLNVEKQKALALGADVQSTTAILSSKIEEQQVKVDALQGELYSLQANEPIPEEELVSEPDEYDEEGNLVSIGSSYYEETSAHAFWRSEVSKLEGEIEVEESRLNQMQAIEVRLQSISNKNEEQQIKLDGVLAKLEECKEEIEFQKSSFVDVSGEATEKLSRISNVLQEYLSIQIPMFSSFASTYVPSMQRSSNNETKTSSTPPVMASVHRDIRVDIPLAAHGAGLAGESGSYKNAGCGYPVKGMCETQSCNYIMNSEELDKEERIEGRPSYSDQFLKITDQDATSFRDNRLGFDIDVSHIVYVFTANDRTRISAPMLDRCDVIEIPAPNKSEIENIVCGSVIPKTIGLHNAGSDISFSDEAIEFVFQSLWNGSDTSLRQYQNLITKCVNAANFVRICEERAIVIQKADVEVQLRKISSPSTSKGKIGFC